MEPADIFAVDIDLHQLGSSCSGYSFGRFQQRGAVTSGSPAGNDVQVVEEGDSAVIPDVGSQGQPATPTGIIREKSDSRHPGQEPNETLFEHLRTSCRDVQPLIESVEQACHGVSVGPCRHPGCRNLARIHSLNVPYSTTSTRRSGIVCSAIPHCCYGTGRTAVARTESAPQEGLETGAALAGPVQVSVS